MHAGEHSILGSPTAGRHCFPHGCPHKTRQMVVHGLLRRSVSLATEQVPATPPTLQETHVPDQLWTLHARLETAAVRSHVTQTANRCAGEAGVIASSLSPLGHDVFVLETLDEKQRTRPRASPSLDALHARGRNLVVDSSHRCGAPRRAPREVTHHKIICICTPTRRDRRSPARPFEVCQKRSRSPSYPGNGSACCDDQPYSPARLLPATVQPFPTAFTNLPLSCQLASAELSFVPSLRSPSSHPHQSRCRRLQRAQEQRLRYAPALTVRARGYHDNEPGPPPPWISPRFRIGPTFRTYQMRSSPSEISSTTTAAFLSMKSTSTFSAS